MPRRGEARHRRRRSRSISDSDSDSDSEHRDWRDNRHSSRRRREPRGRSRSRSLDGPEAPLRDQRAATASWLAATATATATATGTGTGTAAVRGSGSGKSPPHRQPHQSQIDATPPPPRVRDAFYRLLSVEFRGRCSTRSVAALRAMVREFCSAPSGDGARELLSAFEVRLLEEQEEAPENLIFVWYALDAALKELRAADFAPAVEIVTRALPRLLERFVPWDGPPEELRPFLRMVHTWRTFVPPHVLQYAASLEALVR